MVSKTDQKLSVPGINKICVKLESETHTVSALKRDDVKFYFVPGGDRPVGGGGYSYFQ